MDRLTIFYDIQGKKLADDNILLPITLYKGMKMTIHGHEGTTYEVVDWNYHKGHPAEDAGLRIILKPID
jgi:hypothetical protein